MIVLWCVLAAVYGVLAAEALPRAAYRLGVEAGRPWRPACPAGHPLPEGPRGWTGRGTCRDCGASYGPRPVLVRTTAVGAAVLLVLSTGARPELAVWLLLVPSGLLLALVDAQVRRLPDVLTLPMAGGTAVLLGAAELLPGEAGSWAGALLGGVALAGFHFVLFLVNPAGMGFGDVKLALTAGLALGWYGWGVLFAGAFAGFVTGALTGLVLVARGRAHRRTALPFGPCLLAGTLAGVVFGGLVAG